MLQQTVARIEPLVSRDRVIVVTGADQAAATRAQLPEVPAHNVIAEPAPRDTAPCVGLAAGIVAQRDPTGTMIVMPADHVIEPADAFRATVVAAVAVTFGRYAVELLGVPLDERTVAILTLLALAAVNCLGVKRGSLVQGTLMVLKIGVLLVLIVAGLLKPEMKIEIEVTAKRRAA